MNFEKNVLFCLPIGMSKGTKLVGVPGHSGARAWTLGHRRSPPERTSPCTTTTFSRPRPPAPRRRWPCRRWPAPTAASSSSEPSLTTPGGTTTARYRPPDSSTNRTCRDDDPTSTFTVEWCQLFYGEFSWKVINLEK